MRPIRLQFEAFGSYPDAVDIDFASLAARGLYAITGPTGAGKSTIFDAMVYALYGELPGGREKEDPRSQHAAPDRKTQVTFDFEISRVRYTVHRVPTQMVPRQRGAGFTEKPGTVMLARHEPDGSLTTLSTKVREVAAECARVVGLDSDQFQRVVLLPQGEFSRFLVARDEDREDLLQKLFGSRVYDRVIGWLNDEKNRLGTALARVDQDASHHRTNAINDLAAVRSAWATPVEDGAHTVLVDLDDTESDLDAADLDQLTDDELVALLDQLDSMAIEHEAEMTASAQTASEVTGDAVRLETAVQNFARLSELRARRDERAAQMATHTADAARVQAAERAAPVVDAMAALDLAHQEQIDAIRRRADLELSVTTAFTQLGLDPPAIEAAVVAVTVNDLESQIESDRGLLATLAGAIDTETSARGDHERALLAVAGLEERDAELVAAIASLDERLAQLEPEAALVDSRSAACDALAQSCTDRGALEDLERELAKAQGDARDATDRYDSVLGRFITTQAPRLAETLRPDEPCPVCGSSEHPSPAAHDDGEAVDHAQLVAAQSAMTAASSVVTQLAGEVMTTRGRLGELADRPLADLVAALEQARTQLDLARSASEELTATRALRSESVTELESVRTQLGDARVAVGAAAVALEAARTSLETARDSASHVDAESLDARAAIVAALRVDTSDAGEVLSAVDRVAGAVTQAESRLHDALAISGFPDLAAAQGASMSEVALAELRDAVDAWTREGASLDTAIAEIERLDLPPFVDIAAAEIELAKMRDSAAQAQVIAEARRDAFTSATESLNRARRALGDMFRVIEGSHDVRARRDLVVQVHGTCMGNVGSAGRLDRWVLGGELERVARAANVHLARMTGHRYALRRPDDMRRSLGLAVFDAHTGGTRSTNSLSGGEQFQASLALALGLADVVSHGGTASGITFETLFVDEGFGSLDPDALAAAMDALMSLQEGGRVVGVITHVDAMKETIHAGIEVKLLEGRSGSRLVVNP